MRGVILILILLVVAAIAAVSTGFINIDQTRPAALPDVDATSNGVVAKGGQTPAFDVQTGKVQIGTGERTVKVPEIRIAPTGNAAAPAAQPQPGQPQPSQPTTTDSTQR
jgi:hypothetical protein